MSFSPKSIQPYQRSGSPASSYNNLSVKFELCNPRKKNESMSKERAKRGTLPPAQEQIEKFEKVVEEGNYYGAQHLYKSISARYVAAQRYTEALDILQSGACIQLKHGQVLEGGKYFS